MEVISVINYKGGVGKTTLTSNIATDLAIKGNRVLVIDLDPQTSLTLSFIDIETWENYANELKTIKHWYDEYIKDNTECSLKDLIICPKAVNKKLESFKGSQKIHLICSHLELINIDMELAKKLDGKNHFEFKQNFLKLFSRLKMGLHELKDDYDIVLIDCPPNFNIVTRNAIVASNRYIVPTKADYLSILGINHLDRHIKDLVKEYNSYIVVETKTVTQIKPSLIGVIFTMIEVRNKTPIAAQKEYINRVIGDKYPTFKQFLRTCSSLYADASELGVPAILSKKITSSIKHEVNQITEEILIELKK